MYEERIREMEDKLRQAQEKDSEPSQWRSR